MARSGLEIRFIGVLVTVVCVVIAAPMGVRKALSLPEQTPAISANSLVDQLDTILADEAFSETTISVEALDCGTGEIVYAKNPQTLANPASNLKLLTTATALDVLGPAYSFRTSVLTDGKFEKGVVSGNLYLRGEGDPQLVYETVWKMVKNLQARGVKVVEGNIVADDSYFDKVRTIPDWDRETRDDEAFAYDAPLGALSVNFNAVALFVRPGTNPGDPVEIALETPTEYLVIENLATTGRRGSRNTLRFGRAAEGDKREKLVLEGRVPVNGSPRRYYRTVTDPPRFALTLFAEMLAKEGIEVKGTLRTGKTPPDALALYNHYSDSLGILLRYMNKLSSNFIAEQVLKTLGAEVYGPPGTTPKGVRVLRDYLNRSGLQWDDAILFNGSGLSTRTRVSAQQLVGLLCHLDTDYRRRPDFLSTLPIAGVDGTMRRRMRGTPGEDNVRAKTGSVRGVFGFSGYLQSAEGRHLAFSFLVNDIEGSVRAIKEAQDKWANTLIRGPEQESAPSPEGVVSGSN